VSPFVRARAAAQVRISTNTHILMCSSDAVTAGLVPGKQNYTVEIYTLVSASFSMVSFNSATRMGLEMYASIPAARQRSRSPIIA
jgi:hypothetical protein